jgi:hypothetical protein
VFRADVMQLITHEDMFEVPNYAFLTCRYFSTELQMYILY